MTDTLSQATADPSISTYLDPSSLPFPFCPGCGHHTILRALDRALVSLQWDPKSVVIVTDIGCVGLSDRHFNTHAFHGLHGRSVTYATGIKLANPDLHVIVLIGDGGCGIGGNHLFNAARRNVGVCVLVANNFNFGMTGGEHSVLTPHGAITSTTRMGNPERPLDICATVNVCGAGFVARSTVFEPDLHELIAQALQHDGFALVDIWELCTAYYSPNNRFKKSDMLELLEYGGWATGILARNDRPEYARAYRQRAEAEMRHGEEAQNPARTDQQLRSLPSAGRALTPRFAATLRKRLKTVIAGAAGGKVRSTGHLLCRGAVLSGLYATQRDDYPVTVMSGHSVCETILDTTPIGYTGITRPDVLILVAKEGRANAAPMLAAMTPEDRAYVARDLLPVETRAQVVPLDFKALAFRVTRRNRAILALGAVLRREGWYPVEAIEAATRETQREEIAALNLKALQASADLL